MNIVGDMHIVGDVLFVGYVHIVGVVGVVTFLLKYLMYLLSINITTTNN